MLVKTFPFRKALREIVQDAESTKRIELEADLQLEKNRTVHQDAMPRQALVKCCSLI